MVDLFELELYCNTLLKVDGFRDYCPNGLQIDAGGQEVRRLATAVTASLSVIEQAGQWGADVLLVHHGYFWKGEPLPIRGVKGRRIRALVQQGVSLLAYHLPLDAHLEMGNNRRLGDLLELEGAPVSDDGLLWRASLSTPQTPEQMGSRLAHALGQQPHHLAGSGDISEVVWCTGSAQGHLEQAAILGAQAFISGEMSEQSYHLAAETGVHYFAAGHHATERYGVQALGEHLAATFDLGHRFFDQDNPI
jgi:dinuclear metal center YbgI/SA1388 family protein